MCFWCEYISCPVPPPALVSNDARNVDAYFTTTSSAPAAATVTAPRFCPLINLPGNLRTCLDQTPDTEKVVWCRCRLEKMDCSQRVLKRYLCDPGYRPQLIGLLLSDCERLHRMLREGLASFRKAQGWKPRGRRGRRGGRGRGRLPDVQATAN